MKTKLTTLTLAAGAAMLLSGCISHERTVYRDVARVKVEFENETAGRVFYETLSQSPSTQRTESNTEVDIPVVFEHKRKVVTGPNAGFNRAVEQCDSNKDGRITEVEANIFAASRGKR